MLTDATALTPVLLLSQILFWGSIVYTSLLILRYRKITDWYNRKAGTGIIIHLHFRSLTPLLLTGVFGFTILIIGMLLSASNDNITDQQVNNMLWLSCLTLVYPISWLVWRLVKASRSENPRAARWRLLYDALLNLSVGFGGGIAIIIAVCLTVLGSFTKWDYFFPEKWRDIAGVDVVPQSKKHYWVAAGLAVVAIITQFIPDGDHIAETIAGIVAMAAIGLVAWKVWRTPRKERHSIVWRWGYIAVSFYIVFIVTVWIILITVMLYVFYLILTHVVGSGTEGKSSGRTRHSVSCSHLSHDILGGSNKCNISGDTCPKINGGHCPHQ